MIAKVKLSYTVTCFVKGESEDQIMDWAREHTPSEAQRDAFKSGHYIDESFDEEIVSYVREDSAYDIDLTDKSKKVKFTDYLMEKKTDVYTRLCECRNTKEDLPHLVNIRWEWLQNRGRDKQGFTKEDALVDVLEWLDSNGQCQLADLTREEYDELKR